MSEAQFEIDLKEEAMAAEEAEQAERDAEDDFLQEIADLEYEEFYEQELERDERAREIAEEAE